MEKHSELHAFSEHPEQDKTVRFLYKQALANVMSQKAVYKRDVLRNLKDTPASRLAAEFVTQYINSHLMNFTADCLEKEANNHIRQRHDKEWIRQSLKLAPGTNLIEQLRQPPVTPNSPKTVVLNRSILSPPPKLMNPLSTTLSEAPSLHKIHVKVRKNKEGKIIEDPKEVIKSSKAFDRISKKDQEIILSTTKYTDTFSPTKSEKEHKHSHRRHNDETQKKEISREIKNEKKTKPEDEIPIDDDDAPVLMAAPKRKEKREKRMRTEDYPDVKPRLINAEIEPDETHQLPTDDCLNIRDSKPTLSFIARIKQQMQQEVDNKHDEIEELMALIKEKDEIDSLGSISASFPSMEKKPKHPKQSGFAAVIKTNQPLLDQREAQMLSPKVTPEVLRIFPTSQSSLSPTSKPSPLPAIKTMSSSYSSYDYSD